tara:strand:- start:1853 stop:3058 length:1206 start_codon:yes stop_codon:yes gene_type:complete
MNILSGLRIVEGAAFIAAPMCGMTLAQLGADVIRFDQIGGGIDYKRWPLTAEGNSIYWAEMNKGKRSIAVDLRSEQGRDIVSSLICADDDGAGIFSTNLPARGWLSYEQLSLQRPDLIAHEIVGDRHGGTALDYTVNAKVGFPYITGPEDDERPVNHVLPAWDISTAYLAGLSILAAERHRRLTGQGQRIKLALADVALAAVGHLGLLGEVHVNDSERARHGNYVFGALGRDFTTEDGRRIMVIAITPKQWRSLLDVTNLTEAAAGLGERMQLDLSDEGNRFEAREQICALLEPWVAARRYADIAELFDAAGICWEKYQSLGELARTDPDASEDNPMFHAIEQPDIGTYPVPGPAMQLSGFEREAPAPAPRVGQHTDQILSDILGLDDHHIGRLHDDGVVA